MSSPLCVILRWCFFPDLSRLQGLVAPRESSGWVRVEEGSYLFNLHRAGKAKLSFVFLGGEGLNDGPSIVSASELHIYDVTR
jgi:hypothetical protein